MPKTFKPQVLTANDLVEGDSLFLGREGWTPRIAEARIAASAAEAEALAAEGAAAEDANHVVGPYLVEVALGEAGPWPLARREQIRASGVPTVPVGPAAIDRRRAA